jgi:hypothetical protein
MPKGISFFGSLFQKKNRLPFALTPDRRIARRVA